MSEPRIRTTVYVYYSIQLLLCGILRYVVHWHPFISMRMIIFCCRQQGQDTKEEVASRDLRSELESRERESKEKKDSKARSFTG